MFVEVQSDELELGTETESEGEAGDSAGESSLQQELTSLMEDSYGGSVRGAPRSAPAVSVQVDGQPFIPYATVHSTSGEFVASPGSFATAVALWKSHCGSMRVRVPGNPTADDVPDFRGAGFNASNIQVMLYGSGVRRVVNGVEEGMASELYVADKHDAPLSAFRLIPYGQ